MNRNKKTPTKSQKKEQDEVFTPEYVEAKCKAGAWRVMPLKKADRTTRTHIMYEMIYVVYNEKKELLLHW